MTIPSLLGMNTALSALNAYQQGIDTTGNNIANASTPGYTRETVQLVTNGSIPVTNGGSTAQLPTGVDVAMIGRVRDAFLDIQYRAQSSASGNASTLSTNLQQVQSMLGEPSDHGLSTQMANFWGAWHSVANAPQDAAARQNLVNAAGTLAQSFNSLDNRLATQQTQATAQYNQLAGAAGPVAQDANGIAQLNNAISQANTAGQNPNELLDRRDKLIDDLSRYGKVSVSAQPNGMVQIGFGDAANPLIDTHNAVSWPQTITSATGGSLGALKALAATSGPIGAYRSALDSVAGGVISAVNALHTSTPFFSGTSAGTIAVAVNASQIQTSSTPASGGNDVAQAIAGLQGSAPDQGYASLVAKVGGDVQSAENNEKTSAAVLTNVSNQRQSVSGVSLDEEMTNLMTYQRGYQAAARMMTTMDGMLDTLINHTGTVGL